MSPTAPKRPDDLRPSDARPADPRVADAPAADPRTAEPRSIETAPIDADNHYYEPRDAFTRHMPEAQKHLAIQVRNTDRGERIFIGDQPFTFLHHNYDRVPRPGSLRDMLRSLKRGAGTTGEPADVDEPVQPAYLHRDARLDTLDAQGLAACLLFPTLAVCVEHAMRHDPNQLYANFESFNRWLDDDWGYAHADRISPRR